MGIRVETPAALKGTPEQQLLQMYSYLFRLSENLNVALNSLNKDNYASATELNAVNGSSGGSGGASGSVDLSDSYSELRSLIVNTADIVRAEMNKKTSELSSQYTAMSEEWGSYQETVTSTIETTANSIVQSYGYDAKIESLQEQASGFSEYQISTEGYIRQGFIDYDENNIPIVGVAIGQNLKSTTVTVNGEEFEQIDKTQNCAFYTATKVSFRINGQEVAYVSNRKLYIGDVEITGSVILGGEWMITTTNGLKIQWVGEVQ